MNKAYILYNPIAGTGVTESDLSVLSFVMDAELVFVDITGIDDYSAIIGCLDMEDALVLAGGDGTLNRFVNATDGMDIPCQIYYFPSGSGNDFAVDVGESGENRLFSITQYLKDLPMVTVKGKQYRFLNGVGYGIDGYCCEVGEKRRKETGKKVDYTAIAIRGLLLDYIPTSATVTVDGERHEYRKVWIAPTMLGSRYGGGMIPTPAQHRQDPEGKLSVMIFHGSGKLKTLMVFPSIFKGTHVRHEDCVEVLTGHEITVEFSQPRPLQIDGETIPDVCAYTAKSGARVKMSALL